MYTLTQIERQIDPGRSCTKTTTFQYNGGKLNRKSFLFFFSSFIFWILAILIIDSWNITIRISFHGNFILEKVALMLKIDTKNKCLSWDNIYYWINSVNSTSFSKIFYMPFFSLSTYFSISIFKKNFFLDKWGEKFYFKVSCQLHD